MADIDQIARVLRRGIGFGAENLVTDKQFSESARMISEIEQPSVEDLERIGSQVVGNAQIFRNTDLRTLNTVLQELRGKRLYTEAPKKKKPDGKRK